MNLTDFKTWFRAQWDNPSAEHDARSILSAFKVGVWLTMLNLALAGSLALTIFVLPEDRDFRELILERGMGHCLISACQLTLAWFLTLVLPIRAAGLLDAARKAEYFDQIVSTGISPGRYFFGKWLTSQAFVLVLMGTTMPYVILFSSFGITDPLEPLVNYFHIYLYANAVLLVTMALGVMTFEWLAVTLVTIIGAISCLVEITPVPANWAFWTPTRTIAAPYLQSLILDSFGNDGPAFLHLSEHFELLGLSVPQAWARPFVWIVAGLFSWAAITMGPRHFFSVGLNNFDSVVLAGDNTRAMLFRMRPLLTRRVQLAFFYESRPAWLARYDLPIRALGRFLLFSGLMLISIGAMFSSEWVTIAGNGSDLFIGLTCCSFGAISNYVLWTPRIRTDFRSRWRTPFGFASGVVTLDAFTFVALGALGLLVLVLGLSFHETALSGLRYNSYNGPSSYGQLFYLSIEWYLVLWLYLFSVFLVARLIALANLSRFVVFIFVSLYSMVSLLGPLLVGGLFASIARSSRRLTDDEPNALFEFLSTLTHFSPIGRFVVTYTPNRTPFGDNFLGNFGFWIYMPIWIAVLSAILLYRLRSMPKDPAQEFLEPAPIPSLLEEPKPAPKVEPRAKAGIVVTTHKTTRAVHKKEVAAAAKTQAPPDKALDNGAAEAEKPDRPESLAEAPATADPKGAE